MSAAEAAAPAVFESESVPPPVGSTTFSPQLWKKVRDRGIRPRWAGELDETPELRQEFLAGARLLGLELVDLDDQAAVDELRAREIPFDPIQPQQLLVADALNASHGRAAIEIPRRASKTTSILAWCLGRCVSRKRYKVTFSASKGLYGMQALDEWKRDMLDRVNPPDDSDIAPWLRDRPRAPRVNKAAARHVALFGEELVTPQPEDEGPKSRGFRILTGNTKAGIYFDNGSSFVVVKPEASAYRGKAGDINWLDEAQDLAALDADALIAGILPLQDTRPGSKLIVSGTAGEVRAGALWRYLDKLRNGDPEVGGLDFAVDPHTDWELVKDEDAAIEVLKTIHPGIGTLTTEDKMRASYRDMPDKPKWAREYWSLWPETFGIAAIKPEWIERALRAEWPELPTRVAFGLDVKPGGSSAALVAAWRDHRGFAYLEAIEHAPGTVWPPELMQKLTRAYRGSTVAYDNLGEGGTTATEAQRLRPAPKMRIQSYTETAKGSVQFERDLTRGTLRLNAHPGNPITGAMRIATKRDVRNNAGMWLYSADPGDDASPLIAGVRALRNWDQWFAKKTGDTGTGIVTAGA